MSKLHRKQLLDLVGKYLDHTASAEEAELLEAYWKLFDDAPKALDQISPEHLRDIEAQLKSNIDEGIQAIENPVVPFYRWRKIAIAAAVATILFGAGLFYFNRNIKTEQIITRANDIPPGKSAATLTLANGKKIRLADAANGEIANQAGITVTKTADGQLVYQIKDHANRADNINTLTTAKGETYMLTLPDQSKVWLNAASSLTYTASLNERGKRVVRLSGEGYFEITKDKTHPFIVESKGQQVEVLGTHFNVSAYEDDGDLRTTLLEGSVKVNENRILKPGEQSIIIGSNIKVQQVNAEDVIAWKNGLFVFEDEPLQNVMRKVARWYNVEVIYEQNVNRNELYGGSVSRYDKVSKVLEGLELTKGIHFKIEGRRITVMQ